MNHLIFSNGVIVCRRFEATFYKQPLYMAKPSTFNNIFFDNITPMKYGINSRGKVTCSGIEDYKMTLCNFFCKQYFNKQHLAKI